MGLTLNINSGYYKNYDGNEFSNERFKAASKDSLTKEEFTHMGPWDSIKDIFRTNSKKEALDQIYDTYFNKDSLKIENIISLCTLVKDEEKENFKVVNTDALDPYDHFCKSSLYIKGKEVLKITPDQYLSFGLKTLLADKEHKDHKILPFSNFPYEFKEIDKIYGKGFIKQHQEEKALNQLNNGINKEEDLLNKIQENWVKDNKDYIARNESVIKMLAKLSKVPDHSLYIDEDLINMIEKSFSINVIHNYINLDNNGQDNNFGVNVFINDQIKLKENINFEATENLGEIGELNIDPNNAHKMV